MASNLFDFIANKSKPTDWITVEGKRVLRLKLCPKCFARNPISRSICYSCHADLREPFPPLRLRDMKNSKYKEKRR